MPENNNSIIEKLNLIYKFGNKFLCAVKIRDNTFTQSDFVDLSQAFPRSYKIANKIYNNKNKDAILNLLLGPLILDMEMLKIPKSNQTARDLVDIIMNRSNDLIDDIYQDFNSRLGEDIVIPSEVDTAIYMTSVMTNISIYMKEKIKQRKLDLNETKLYDFMDYLNESAISGQDNTYNYFTMKNWLGVDDNEEDYDETAPVYSTFSESIVGFDSGSYSTLDNIYKKTVSKFLYIINQKRLHVEEYYTLPNVNMFSCYLGALSMVYCSTMYGD